MTATCRLLSLLLVIALTGPGILMPPGAVAQSESQPPQPAAPSEAPSSQPAPPAEATPSQPAAPAVPPPPAAPPQAQPPQPDLYQEALKASRPGDQQYEGAYQAGALVASTFSVPGRVVLCAIGSGLTLVTLAVTFGSGYEVAKAIFEEGCGGKWVVTSDDLRRANEPRRGIRRDAAMYWP